MLPTELAATEDGLATIDGAAALQTTIVVAVLLLLAETGSLAADATIAVLLIIVPTGVAPPTCTTTCNCAVSLAATAAFEKTTLPESLPTAGAVKVQPVPLITAAETKVVLTGSASVTVTFEAEFAVELFEKLIV